MICKLFTLLVIGLLGGTLVVGLVSSFLRMEITAVGQAWSVGVAIDAGVVNADYHVDVPALRPRRPRMHVDCSRALLPFVAQLRLPKFTREAQALPPGSSVQAEKLAGVVPLWAIASPLGAATAILLRWGKAKQPGHCQNCGYDLRAGHQKCPECGATARKSDEIGVREPPEDRP